MKERVFDLSDISCEDFVLGYNSIEEFISTFRMHFDYIVAYHATLIDLAEKSSISNHGLTVASQELLKEKAKARFIGESDAEDLRDQIDSEINHYFKTTSLITVGEINFGLIQEELFTRSYQYLLFGPESLLPLADRLTEKFQIPFRQRMMKFGNPHLIKVQVPTANTDDDWVGNIYEYCVNYYPEASLVYHFDLPSSLILEIRQVPPPVNRSHMPLY